MIVKNPRGVTIVYGFANLTLTAGATAEIDNSYIENIEFQKSQSVGDISVVKFEKDFVSNTVVISLGVPPTEPSQNQKGAMVAANAPTPLNPFATMVDLQLAHVRLYKESLTEVALDGVYSKTVHINSAVERITSPIIYDLTTMFAIDANGNALLTLFPADTIGYVYLSGKNVSLGEKLLRVSEVAPGFFTDGYYLNSNRNWLFVGWIKTNASSQLDNNLSVASYYYDHNDTVFVDSLVGTITASLPNTIDTLHTFPILVPPLWSYRVDASFEISTTNPLEYVDWYINGDIIHEQLDSGEATGFDYYYNDTASPVEQNVLVAMKGTTDEHSCDLSTLRMIVKRDRK